MDNDSILKEIDVELKQMSPTGKVASYLPELAHVDVSKFGDIC